MDVSAAPGLGVRSTADDPNATCYADLDDPNLVFFIGQPCEEIGKLQPYLHLDRRISEPETATKHSRALESACT